MFEVSAKFVDVNADSKIIRIAVANFSTEYDAKCWLDTALLNGAVEIRMKRK